MIKKGGIMTKRDIFSELQEGMNAWSEFNEGKKTLNKMVEKRPDTLIELAGL